jgi:DNA excision repair protein ERCC-4
MLEGTIEEEGFVNAIQRENKAFEKLIQEKSVMVVRSNQDGKSTLVSSLPIQGGRIDNMPSSNSISRKGGGTSSKTNPHKIVIDMREFRSALPGYLHLRNMELSPITLEVGDYILSPRICVERKSIPDLIGSFSSGRLYNQLTAMTRYYNVPILLIEFEASKPFMLQDSRFLGDEINPNSLITKLCLAALHFPEVRFVWSRGAHLTAEIFESLKEHEFEPDEAQAALIGLDTSAAPNTSEVSADNPESEEIMENTYENDELEDAEDNIFSDQHLPVDMLKSLPGINSSTLLSILNCQGIRNLYDLFNAEPETLSQIIGQSNSNMLLRFIQTEEDS